MRNYSFLPHTCDIRLKVQAESLKELFLAALEGMNAILKGNRTSSEEVTCEQKIRLEALDETSLLIDFLSEVLTMAHTEHCLFEEVQIQHLTETELKASLIGRPVEAFEEDIKAVTYHEAEVQKNEKGYYESLVVFDI